MRIINEFKSIIWPDRKQVTKEFLVVLLGSIIGTVFILLINIIMAGILNLVL